MANVTSATTSPPGHSLALTSPPGHGLAPPGPPGPHMPVLQDIMYYMLGPVLTCITIVGVLGNGLTFFALGKCQGDSSSTLLLKVLAVVDTLVLITWWWWISFEQFVNNNLPHDYLEYYINWVKPYVYVYLSHAIALLVMMSAWLVVLVAANRHTVVCWPLRAASLCRKKYVWFEMMATFVVALVLNVPGFLVQKVSVVHLNATASNGTMMISKAVVDNIFDQGVTNGVRVYVDIMHGFFMAIAPLFLVCLFNIRIISILGARNVDLNPSQRPQNRDEITMTMVVAVVVLAICQLPKVVIKVVSAFEWGLGLRILPFEAFLVIFMTDMVMQSLNNAINVIVYCVLRPQFRKGVKALFCPD